MKHRLSWLLIALAAILVLACAAQAETRTITVTCTGDVLPGSNDLVRDKDYSFQSYIEKYGYAYPFEKLQTLFANDDITFINLECVLNDDAADSKSRYCFRGPTDYAKVLSAGSIEVANLANNHIDNYGQAGYDSTLKALESEGIGYCGSVEFGSNACFVDVDGIRIGFVGVYPLYYKDHPEKTEQCFQYLKDNDCAVIIAAVHAGAEYSATHGSIHDRYGRILANLGANLVIGNHPHVPQGVNVFNGVTQIFSLGNCSFGGNTGVDEKVECIQSSIAQFTLYFEDGVYQGHQLTLWPIHISGTSPENNYQPVLVEGDAANVVMKKIQKDSSIRLVGYQDGEGAVQKYVEWPKKNKK